MEKLNKLEAYCTQNLARSLNLYIMKLRDLIGNSERTTDGIKRILTTRDENGNLNILKSVEAESAVQKFMRIGYVDTKGQDTAAGEAGAGSKVWKPCQKRCKSLLLWRKGY